MPSTVSSQPANVRSGRNHLTGIKFDTMILYELFSEAMKEPIPWHPLLWLYRAEY